MLDSALLERAQTMAARADLCLVIGTSAVVYPAAGIPLATLHAGGRIIEVNPQATDLTRAAEVALRGAAGEILPEPDARVIRPGASGSLRPMWTIVLAAAIVGCAHNRAETSATAQDAGPGPSAATTAQQRALFLWGGADAEGTPHLDPAFVLDAPPSPPKARAGTRSRAATPTAPSCSRCGSRCP